VRRAFSIVWHDANLLMLTVAFVIFGCFVSSIGIYQSLLAITVFGLPDAVFSIVVALAMAVNVTASVTVGVLTDQRARRRTVAIGSALATATGAAMMSLWPSAHTFIVAHILFFPIGGTLFAQFFALSRLAAAGYTQTERDSVLAIIRAAFAVPFVVILPVWGIVFDQGVPLTRIYPVVVVIALTLVAVLWRYWPADGTAPWSGHKSGLSITASLREMAAAPVLLRVFFVGAIHVGSSIGGIIVGLLLNDAAGRGAADVGLFFGIFVAIEVVVTLMVGTLVQRWSRLSIIGSGVALYAVFLVLLPNLAGTPWLWALTLPAGAGGAMIYTLAISYVQELLGMRAGAGSALIAIQRIATESLSAAIFAFGSWLMGYGLVAYMAAGTIVVSMVAIRLLDARGRRS